MDFSEVIKELVSEKGLDKDAVIDLVCDGVKASYLKKYPGYEFSIRFNKKNSQIEVFVSKRVVASGSAITDPKLEASLSMALVHDSSAAVGETVLFPFEKTIGRVDVVAARAVIASGIRQLEESRIFDKFSDRQGCLISGTIHKKEFSGYSVNLGDCIAFLPKSCSIPDQELRSGTPIRALIKEVHQAAMRGGYQVVLDRASAEFLIKLLESEVPEIFEGAVVIKAVERIAGYKSKVALTSVRKNIDPVGACVGIGGSRIRPISKELGEAERIDLIRWSENIEEYIRESLKPATVKSIEVLKDGTATIFVEEDQRAVAIGKKGQNVAMASAITGIKINLGKVD